MLPCYHSSVTRIEVEVNTHLIRQSTWVGGIDRSRRLTAQVTDSKGVVGENHGAFLAKEESGDETVCAIYIGWVPKDRRYGSRDIPFARVSISQQFSESHCSCRSPQE